MVDLDVGTGPICQYCPPGAHTSHHTAGFWTFLCLGAVSDMKENREETNSRPWGYSTHGRYIVHTDCGLMEVPITAVMFSCSWSIPWTSIGRENSFSQFFSQCCERIIPVYFSFEIWKHGDVTKRRSSQRIRRVGNKAVQLIGREKKANCKMSVVNIHHNLD